MRTLEEVLAAHPPPFVNPDGTPGQFEPLQVEDIHKLVTFGRALGDLPVGYGKTGLSTYSALMLDPDTTLILMPPILLVQWAKWLRSIPGIGEVVVYAGTPKTRRELPIARARWVLASFGIFRNDFEYLQRTFSERKTLTIVDECFPAGTLVETPQGVVPIEQLEAGQKVLTSAGERTILEVFQSLTRVIVILELSDGTRIRCTPNHPVFTDRGWLAAQGCEGRRVLSAAAVPNLQQGISAANIDSQFCTPAGHADWDHLLQTVHAPPAEDSKSRSLRENWGCLEGEALDGTPSSWKVESTAVTRPSGGGVGYAEGSKVGAANPGRQRNWNDVGREPDSGSDVISGAGMELRGTSGETKAARVPDALQVGLWQPDSAYSGRGGRQFASTAGETDTGPEKGSETEGLRVVNVSRLELADPERVWNLHVEGRHDYFAGGILVHNCQEMKNHNSKLYACVKQLAEGQHLFQLSGTPASWPGDLYSYIKLHSPDCYRTYVQFEAIHVEERDFFDKPTKWRELELMQENFSRRRVYRTKEEVHSNLPKANYIPVYYDLDPEHMALYRKLMTEQLLELEDGTKIDATTAQTLYHQAQQIITSWSYFASDETKVAKVFELIDEVCSEIGLTQTAEERALVGQGPASKLIMWTTYTRSTAAVQEYMDTMLQAQHTGTGKRKVSKGLYAMAAYSGADSKKSIAAFLDDPQCVSLNANPRSAGAGLNPQGVCWEMAFVEIPTRTVAFVQAAGRIDRKGQRFNPNIRLFIARGTIQETLLRNLLSNDDEIMRASGTKNSIRELLFPK